jgi:hypothetical protein
VNCWATVECPFGTDQVDDAVRKAKWGSEIAVLQSEINKIKRLLIEKTENEKG